MKGQELYKNQAVSYDGTQVPDLMTEEELIQFLRIPEVSTAKDYANVVYNLIRMRDLPRIHICNKILYPTKAVLEWIDKETIRN